MDKATAQNASKKDDYIKIPESSRNRSEGSENTLDVRRDVARRLSVAALMKAAEVPAVKVESNAVFLRDLDEDRVITEHNPDYTDTSVTITRFEDIFLTRHYIGRDGNSVPVENALVSGKLSGNSDARAARKARRHVGARYRDESVSENQIKTQ
ncbi:hypothetical protein MTO96_022391 [Rhipicephalus appendiculatus]